MIEHIGTLSGHLTLGPDYQAQRQRYASFRRFVLGFYTPAFRDLFFSSDPPKHMFRAVVTVLAGYWRPSLATRAWLALFFLSVRLQQRLGFAASHLAE